MSVPSFVAKGYPLDLSLSGARVAMVDPLPHFRKMQRRRSSLESTGSSSPSDNLNDIHTCSTVNSRLLAHTQKVHGTILPGHEDRQHRDMSAKHSEGSGYGVHLRNVPNGIAPITHHSSKLCNHENLITDSSLQEAQIIRNALQLDRYRVGQPSSKTGVINDYEVLPSPSQGSLYDKLRSPESTLDSGNKHESSGWLKNNLTDSMVKHLTQSPITPPSYRSLPLRSQPNCSNVISPNDMCVLRRNSSIDDSVPGTRENSAVLDSKLSREATREEVLNELIEETREQIAALKTKKKRDKKKKKKRQGRTVSQLSAKSRKSSASIRITQATAMSAGIPYEPPTLQAFCKPISVLVSKPDKSRPKYTPAQSGAWAPSKHLPGTTGLSHGKIQSVGPKVPSSNAALHSMSEIRISPRKSVEIGALRKIYGRKDLDDGTLHKLIKVFLSEKQSGVLKELGVEFPCAPPATPTPEVLKKYEYVPSMNDCRAQRAFRLRLEAMEKIEKIKVEKLKEEKIKQAKVNQKEQERAIRKRQRLQIYALNKIMTEFENKNFLEFCKANGINPS